MDRKKIIIKNGLAGLIAQGVAQVLNFVLRFFLLKYIGIDILGISATLSSVLATLSLSELGFETATVFYLYKPLDLCQYFGHKKLNFSPSITYAERIIS